MQVEKAVSSFIQCVKALLLFFFFFCNSFYRYLQRAPTPWTAITTASLFFVICMLVGHILYGAAIHILKVEDDFNKMQELKVRAEAADVAKSQVRS